MVVVSQWEAHRSVPPNSEETTGHLFRSVEFMHHCHWLIQKVHDATQQQGGKHLLDVMYLVQSVDIRNKGVGDASSEQSHVRRNSMHAS